MNLVHNEQIKLLANLLNAMAGSSFTVGVAAPIAAAIFYNPTSLRVGAVIVGVIFWIGTAAVLHSLAQRMLKRLRE